ncbi:MAG: ATP-dependent DNA helicase, partial [Bacteroidales bacterium]|nr:ATP-dependent DNA helicase [Bacteroidales bacterium]
SSQSEPTDKPRRLQRIQPNATPPSAASPTDENIRVGVQIEHNRFGVGEIIHIEGSGDNCKVTVAFRNAGTKQLLLKFARFTIVGQPI